MDLEASWLQYTLTTLRMIPKPTQLLNFTEPWTSKNSQRRVAYMPCCRGWYTTRPITDQVVMNDTKGSLLDLGTLLIIYPEVLGVIIIIGKQTQ